MHPIMYHSRFSLHASMVGIDYVLTHRVELQDLAHIHLTEKCKQSVSFQVSSTSQSFRQPFWKLACRPHPHSTTPVKVWSLHEYFEKKPQKSYIQRLMVWIPNGVCHPQSSVPILCFFSRPFVHTQSCSPPIAPVTVDRWNLVLTLSVTS